MQPANSESKLILEGENLFYESNILKTFLSLFSIPSSNIIATVPHYSPRKESSCGSNGERINSISCIRRFPKALVKRRASHEPNPMSVWVDSSN